MKRFLSALICAAVLAVPVFADTNGESKTENKKEKTEVVKKQKKQAAVEDSEAEEEESDAKHVYDLQKMEYEFQLQKQADKRAGKIAEFEDIYQPALELVFAIALPILAGVTVVIAILIFMYMKKRRYYKMVEKAIESNYQLPDNVGEGTPKKKTSSIPVNPEMAVISPVKWKGMKNGLLYAGIGACLSFAFNSQPMSSLCAILIVVGVVKIVMNILQVRDMEKQLAYRREQQQYSAPEPPEMPKNEPVAETKQGETEEPEVVVPEVVEPETVSEEMPKIESEDK